MEMRHRFPGGCRVTPAAFVEKVSGPTGPPEEEETMSQYLLSVHHAEGEEMPSTPEEMQPMFDAVGRFNEKARDAGIWVFAGGLVPIESATTVDGTGAEPIVTDGPFSESKEWLGGFWIFELPDLDAALVWATEGSKACGAPVEVRPFQD